MTFKKVEQSKIDQVNEWLESVELPKIENPTNCMVCEHFNRCGTADRFKQGMVHDRDGVMELVDHPVFLVESDTDDTPDPDGVAIHNYVHYMDDNFERIEELSNENEERELEEISRQVAHHVAERIAEAIKGGHDGGIIVISGDFEENDEPVSGFIAFSDDGSGLPGSEYEM